MGWAQERAETEPSGAGDEYTYEYQEEPVIRDALEQVLSQDAFRRLRQQEEEPQTEEESTEDEEPETPEEKGWAERFWDWLDEKSPDSEDDSRSRSGSAGFDFSIPGLNLLVYGMAAAILLAVVFLILKSIARSSRSHGGVEEPTTEISALLTPPGEQSPEEYWTRAQKFAEARQFKSAIREILLGAMSFIERKGLIRHRKGLTNRDYYWASRGVSRDAFEAIAREFELVHFGRRQATAEGFRECRQAFEKSFRSEAL